MATKKYPIGTKIRFINPNLDTNKEGVIVAILPNGHPTVYLPTADKHINQNYYPTLDDGTKFTWRCSWDEIEPISVKGQQLLFEFMYNG